MFNKMDKKIFVTKPFLPPFEEYSKILEKIWKTSIITNMGPISKNLENELKSHLGVKNLHFVSNGTIALQLAIKALDLKGEIITTPFSYVASREAEVEVVDKLITVYGGKWTSAPSLSYKVVRKIKN